MTTTGSLWTPQSNCGAGCLPPPGAVPRAGRLRQAARLGGLCAVLAVAFAGLPLLLRFPTRARSAGGRMVARALVRSSGVTHSLRGSIPQGPALVVANHLSWLDILVLLVYLPARPLAKHQVQQWPVLGALAAVTRTLYIDRSRPRALPDTVAEVATALRSGDTVAAFPQGTTWCGVTSGPLRPALFQAAIDAGVPTIPISLRFELADGRSTTVAAFVGQDTIVASVRRVVATNGLRIVLEAHPALPPAPDIDRRSLSRTANALVTVRPL